MKNYLVGTTFALSLLTWMAPPLCADVIYSVTMNTSGLGNGSILDFQMDDFANPGDGNNTATIANLNLNGGSLGSVNPFSAPPGSDESGSLSTTLKITDGPGIFGGGINDFNQAFNPGSSLSFTLDLSTNVSSAEAATPDQFSFTVYNAAQTSESVLLINITGNNLSPINGIDAGSTAGAPLIEAEPYQSPSPVPEPASLSLFGLGLGTLAAGSWRCRKRAACGKD